jgi:lysophospholipase L1-like esterase
VTRVLSVGDSFAHGVGDVAASGPLAGWSGRLAHQIGATRHLNLGRPGAVMAEMERLLAAAPAFEPDLVLVSIGGNDVMRAGFDATVFKSRLTAALAPVAGSDSRIVVLTVPDLASSGLLPARVRRALHARLHALNDAINASAAELGALVVDRWHDAAAYDPRHLHPDHVHPSPSGYQLLAERTLARLGLESVNVPLPTDAVSRTRGFWLVTSGVSWALRRGALVLPGLLELSLTGRRQTGECSGCRPAAPTGDFGMARQASAASSARPPARNHAVA